MDEREKEKKKSEKKTYLVSSMLRPSSICDWKKVDGGSQEKDGSKGGEREGKIREIQMSERRKEGEKWRKKKKEKRKNVGKRKRKK
jgi:hypothetical protein